MIGTQAGEPKVACPFHKKTFSLQTGACLSGDDYEIKTYPVKIEGDAVWIGV
jgi:nitrite reductase (NADH) small subunit